MGRGRFRTEEELVIDSVALRPSGIRPWSRDTWLLEKGGRWDRAVRSRGGVELRWGGAGRGEEGRGGARQLSKVGLCADGPFRGGACADLGPGRDWVRLGIARAQRTLLCAGWRVPC